MDENELPAKLDHALTLGETDRIQAQASPHLIATIRNFLEGRPDLIETPSTGAREGLVTLDMKSLIAGEQRQVSK